MTTSDDVRYASADDVLLALDTEPEHAPERLKKRAKKRAAAATQKWINVTGRPFHEARFGDPDDPRTWDVYDAGDARSFQPVRLLLNNSMILPLDPEEGDAIEVRTTRDNWDDVTDREGRSWTLDHRRSRLHVYRRRLNLIPFDDPKTRFCRLTYRFGPLGESVKIDEDGVVTSVPADVSGAVASKAAMQLVLDDEAGKGIPDEGQLTDRSSKHSAFESEWEETTAEHCGFSPL